MKFARTNTLHRLHRPLSRLLAAVFLGGALFAADAAAQPTEYLLKQILIETTIDSAERLTKQPDRGFVVVPTPVSGIDASDLAKVLAAAENRPINERLLVALAQVIQAYFRQRDYPIATAIIPQQKISDGAVRVAVLLGKFRDIKIQGNRWFSESLIREKLRVERGELLRLSELDQALTWTNNSPFRRVRVHIDPIPDSGEANLIIGVEERFPLRAHASFDNGGNDVIGSHRIFGGASYGNLWGKDHEFSYQMVTTNLSRKYLAHAVNYRIPLPWRHHLQASASYSRARPDFFDGLFVQDGKNLTTELRYSAPIKNRWLPLEAFGSLNYKQSNNNLEFGGSEVEASSIDTFLVNFGFSSLRRDQRGAWLAGVSVSASPGDFNSRNTDAAFAPVRFGAKARYLVGNLTLQRALALGGGWELNSKLLVQAASTNLMSGEQITIGGATSVRGFQENTFVGDRGFVLTQEIQPPVRSKPVDLGPNRRRSLDYRPIFFFDAGSTDFKHRIGIDRRHAALASVGLGLRAAIAGSLSFALDHGWQVTRLPNPQPHRYRTHVKVAFAY